MGNVRTLTSLRAIFAILPLMIAVVPHINLSPMWDGAIYAGCIINSVSDGFNLWTLNCSHHPSVASLLPAAVAYKLSGGALWSIHTANLVLAICAVWCFLGILDTMYPKTSQNERSLAAACMSAMPIVSASVLHTNSDHGMFVFSLILMFALLRKQRWLAAVASAALPLTKDLGIVIWLIIIGSYFVVAILRQEGRVTEKLRKIIFFWPVLSAPTAFFWYAAARLARGLPVLKPPSEYGLSHLLLEALSFSPSDPVLRAYLSSIFVLNFSWILSSIILCGLLGWFIRKVFVASNPANCKHHELVALLFVSLLVLLTRFKTFLNVRYFLPIFPIILLAAFHALQSLLPWKSLRSLVLTAILLLFHISTLRTIDPISKRVYGSFMFGRNPLLDMTSITGECCGRGRDQLVYNIEFTFFDSLANDLLADLRPNPSFPIVVANYSEFFYLGGVMGSDSPKRVAVPIANSTPAPLIISSSLDSMPKEKLPERIIWLDLPNINGDADFKKLLSSFTVMQEKLYDRQGYQISAKIMQRL